MRSKHSWFYSALIAIALGLVVYNAYTLAQTEKKLIELKFQIDNVEKKDEEQNKLLQEKSELQAKRPIQLSLLIGCIGLTSFFIASFNIVIKYNRSFGYYLSQPRNEKDDNKKTSNQEITNEDTKQQCVTIINYRDKTETIVSAFFKGYTTKIEIHSKQDEPYALAAFSHISINFDSQELTKYIGYEKIFTLHVVTGDGGIYKCRLVDFKEEL